MVFVAVAILASAALAAGTAYLVVRWSRRRVLWALAPVFLVLWFLIGAVPLVLMGKYFAGQRAAAAAVEAERAAAIARDLRERGVAEQNRTAGER